MSQRKGCEPTVTLHSESGEALQVPVDVCKISEFVKPMLPDEGEVSDISIPNVRTEVLQKVIGFCKYHHDHPMDLLILRLLDQKLSRVQNLLKLIVQQV